MKKLFEGSDTIIYEAINGSEFELGRTTEQVIFRTNDSIIVFDYEEFKEMIEVFNNAL